MTHFFIFTNVSWHIGSFLACSHLLTRQILFLYLKLQSCSEATWWQFALTLQWEQRGNNLKVVQFIHMTKYLSDLQKYKSYNNQ